MSDTETLRHAEIEQIEESERLEVSWFVRLSAAKQFMHVAGMTDVASEGDEGQKALDSAKTDFQSLDFRGGDANSGAAQATNTREEAVAHEYNSTPYPMLFNLLILVMPLVTSRSSSRT